MTRFFVLLMLTLFCGSAKELYAQDLLSVQLKTFDQQLKPLGNLEVSVNNREFIQVSAKGSAIVELPQNDLPPKSVTVKNNELEAESWNYSRGVLEIIIRKKSYKLITVTVRQEDGTAVADAALTFQGRKIFQGKTSIAGKVEIPLALSETISSQSQFSIPNFVIARIQNGEKDCILFVRPVQAKTQVAVTEPRKESASFNNFDLNNLDSIQSLTVFYAIFKNYKMANLSDEQKKRIDVKFKQLISQLEDSIRNPGQIFLGKISDSSFVGEDVKNLLAQAEAEKQTLDYLRGSFDEKIQVLNEKLAEGAGNLDAETRGRLLTDINRLETILQQNERKFYKNQNDYRSVLNSLKEKFFDIQDLENKLSISEAQRIEDREEFQRKIFTIFLVTVSFALLTVMLVYFSNRLKKQKKQLEIANGEVKRINENLEALVLERTALLENAHREMDIFLYKASHDLRGPICSIIGLCNIASHTVNAETQEIVEKTYNTAFAMDRMLKKLKVISEINHPSNYSVVMLNDQLNQVKLEYSTFIRDNNVRFKIDCPPSISFHSYPNLVEVILKNLVENALFFSSIKSKDGAAIEVKAIQHQKYVELIVRDNGIGIGQEIRDRIWDMFFIGTEFSHGNGLGLYIVKKSVDALHGTIHLESEKGKYTQFTVHLPMRDALVVGPRQDTQLLTAAS